MDWRKVNEKTAWDATKVVAILKDERYAGNMVSLRRTLKGIYGKDTPMDSSDWIRVEGTHEGIVSIEDFRKHRPRFLNMKKVSRVRSTGTMLLYADIVGESCLTVKTERS